MASPLQNAVQFFKDFGLFDVVLPFLLVFALVFAILEKTRILGTEGAGEKAIPKRNLNTLVAFVIGMITIATNKIVNAINTALPNVVLVIVAFVAFLLMIGIFFGTGEMNFAQQHKKFAMGFIVVSLIILVIIVLDSITLASGQSWLDYLIEYIGNNASGPVVMSILFLIIALVAIVYITTTPKKGE